MLRSSIDELAGIDSIIFDFDGVLVDVSASIMMVHTKAAERYYSLQGWTGCEGLVTPGNVERFKLAGGFNNDWDLAYAWELLYWHKHLKTGYTDGSRLKDASPTIEEYTDEAASTGRGLESTVSFIRRLCSNEDWKKLESVWDKAGLLRVFKETYAGDLCPEIYGFIPEIVKGPGLIRNDRPILDCSLIPSNVKLGVATGRTAGEVHAGIGLMGWTDLLRREYVISEDDGFLKPDPHILDLSVSRMSVNRPVYVGDTPDDLLTVSRYNESYTGKIISCMVTTGLNDPGLIDIFKVRQADIVADNVNAALMILNQCIGGKLCLTAK